jgi:hypothetical protein
MDYMLGKSRIIPVPHRIKSLRSKEAGCRWAASLAALEETRSLLDRIADQYRDLADQLELLNKLWPPRAEPGRQ